MLATAIELLLLALAAPVAIASCYLGLLALLSRRPAAPRAGAPRLSFDVVVPAHDEESGIGRTVRSLLASDWPAHLRRVLVVADNCTDRTAEVARAAGAEVLVRHDPTRRGKGYALALAFEHSLRQGRADAVVVVDADTVTSPNLLRAFAARLEDGASAVQAHYGVANPDASWRTELMAIAFALFHGVRSLGRERLGVSAGLRGNGMCFAARVLREVPHDAFSRVEDLEYGIRLGLAGHRVRYAFEAHVLGDMVPGEHASRSQRRRWEAGRLEMLRRHGAALLGGALRRGDPVLLDLALDVLVPPLATLVGVLGLAGAAAAWASFAAGHVVAAAWPLAVSALALAGYVLRGWALSGTGRRGLVRLAYAPLYVAWKLALKLAPQGDRGAWVRTARQGEAR